MQTILTGWRIRLYSRLLLIPLMLPIVIAVLSADGSSMVTGRLGGDLPAFYGAGVIVAEDRIDHLYNWQAQAEAQAGLFGGDENVFQVFAYPPFVAHAYSPLARLPYSVAYAVHTAFMLAVVAAAVAVLRRILPRVDAWPLEAFVLAAGFYPLYRAVTGGQNSAVSLLIVAGAYWALSKDREVLAGVIVGLLLYKPQLALPVIGLLAVRNWRSVGGVLSTAMAYWAWGAWLGGPGWIGSWLGNIGSFNAADQEVNGVRNVNIVGFAERVLGTHSTAAYAVSGVLAAALAMLLIWLWRDRRIPLDLQIAALVCGMLLIPLHVMFYDAGLLVLPFAILANRHGRDGVKRLVGLVVVSFLSAFADTIGFSPLFFVVVLTGLWVASDIAKVLRSGPQCATPPIVPRTANPNNRSINRPLAT